MMLCVLIEQSAGHRVDVASASCIRTDARDCCVVVAQQGVGSHTNACTKYPNGHDGACRCGFHFDCLLDPRRQDLGGSQRTSWYVGSHMVVAFGGD